MRSTILYSIVGTIAALANASEFAEMGMEMHLAHDLGIVPRATPTNLQAFAKALGSKAASPITHSSDPQRPFQVGQDTFPDLTSAYSRSCDNQKNDCSTVANSGSGGFKVSDCDTQRLECLNSQGSATVKNFQTTVSSNAEFDFVCDV